MFAVIKTGGKQYRVAAGDEIRIEKLEGAAGDTLDLGEVLMLGSEAGVTVGWTPIAPARSSSSRSAAARTTVAPRATASGARSCGSPKSSHRARRPRPR
jgi:ribosomal protein L21